MKTIVLLMCTVFTLSCVSSKEQAPKKVDFSNRSETELFAEKLHDRGVNLLCSQAMVAKCVVDAPSECKTILSISHDACFNAARGRVPEISDSTSRDMFFREYTGCMVKETVVFKKGAPYTKSVLDESLQCMRANPFDNSSIYQILFEEA